MASGEDSAGSGPIGVPFRGLPLAQYEGIGLVMRLLLTLAAALLLPVLSGGRPASAQPERLAPEARRVAPYDEAYERGFREGVRDARRGREPMAEPDGSGRRSPGRRLGRPSDRPSDRGSLSGARRDPRRGMLPEPRRSARGEVQRGYEDGYRAGFTSERDARVAPAPRQHWAPRGPAPDPAYARGQADGYRRGFDDGHGRDRYDATREGTYRDGDAGYFADYGSKGAYRRNYRDGFRQGYEDGYRDGSREPRS
jgi:hypothetical protein